MRRALAIVLWLVSSVATGAEGQSLRVEGEADHPAVTRLRDVVDRGDYLLLGRDTLLPPSSRVPGDLIVAAGRVRVEGTVAGSVVVLPGGEFFLRPGGRVTGSAVSVKGGLYLSRNAAVGERLELPAAIGARLELAGETYTLRLTPAPVPPRLRPTGLFGVGLPTYNRVDGVTLRAGALLRLRADSAAPVLTATALYHTEREKPGAWLVLALPPSDGYRARLELGRRTETNDAWIRGALTNSLAALLARSDARDYHEVDEVAVEVARLPPVELAVGTGFVAPRVRVGASRARSLAAGDPWALYGDDWRSNPPVQEGTILSGVFGGVAGWRGVSTAFTGEGGLELAPPGTGDFEFALLTLVGRWEAAALRDHTLALHARLRHPLGTRPPPQRWSILGGPGTLPTLDSGALRGDHLAFLESTYSVPIPSVTLPLAGSPSVFLRHAIGSAWTGGGRLPPLEQNLGAGLAFRLLRLTVTIDPADTERAVVSLAADLPF